jgi:hypothetical protein
VLHPFFSAEIARQRREALEARAAVERLRRSELPADAGAGDVVRWNALAERIADLGPSSLEVEVRALVRAAQRAGIEGTLLDVLADRRQPDIVRQRAFGRIVRRLARRPEPASSQSEVHRSHDAA